MRVGYYPALPHVNNVAEERQRGAQPDRRSVDRSDNGLGHLEHVNDDPPRLDEQSVQVPRLHVGEPVDVTTGAKGLSMSREDDGLASRTLRDISKKPGHLRMQTGIYGIQIVRPCESHD
jgi:hypothetical protein